MIVRVVLNVGPMSDIEGLVDSIAPLLSLRTDSTVVFLGPKVFSVKSVAPGSLVNKLLRSHRLPIVLCSKHAAAISECTLVLLLSKLLLSHVANISCLQLT